MRKCDKKRTLRRRALGRGSRTRTHDQRFWRPRLYQLSYTPIYEKRNANYRAFRDSNPGPSGYEPDALTN